MIFYERGTPVTFTAIREPFSLILREGTNESFSFQQNCAGKPHQCYLNMCMVFFFVQERILLIRDAVSMSRAKIVALS